MLLKETAEKLGTLENSNQLMSGGMFRQIKAKTSSGRAHLEVQRSPLRFQLYADSPQTLRGANVRGRLKCEPQSQTLEPAG